MKSTRWNEIVLRVPDSYHDLLAGPLAALGFEGFLQEPNALKAFIDTRKWDRHFRQGLEHYLRKFGREFPKLNLRYRTRSIHRKNWNSQWEQTIGILEPAPGIIIKPSWKKLRVRDKHKIVLHIDPKMSFGTGHHETTRLCLRLLQEYVRPAMTVLDFGSGTGILSIAAVKLGAGKAVAVDNDPWTIPNIRENIKRNRVEHRVKAILGGARSIPKTFFDLIVANVDMPTIRNEHLKLIKRLRKGGLLVFSGILTTDLLALQHLIRQEGIMPVTLLEENEWAALAFVRT
ncbi:MAG TPA: 50S ribosomal protein L11 methyltransferase [Bacteroidota bacterium]